MTGIRSRFTYSSLVVALVAVAILVRYLDPFFVRTLRLAAFDTYQRLAPRAYTPDVPIRVVDIDESSLTALGQWPWPRTKLRDLAMQLAEKGAAVIAFDILFAEADRTSIEQIIKQLPVVQAELLAAASAGQPSNDQAFADALKTTPSVLAMSLGEGPHSEFVPKAGFAIAGQDPRPFITAFSGASINLPALDAAARGIGAFNWMPDRDQIVRRVALIFRMNESLVPSLAAEALRVAQGASTYVLKASNASGETAFGQSTGLNHIRIGNVEVPTDESGAVYLHFRHFDGSRYIPAWKVLAGQVPREEIEGRIIFVGTSAPGLLDLRATPLDAAMPGVDMHAQLLENLIEQTLLKRPDYSLALEEFVIVVLGMALAALLPRVSARMAGVVGLLGMGSILIGGWAAFRYAGLLFDPSYPALITGFITAGITTFVYHGVEAQRSQIRQAFGRYLAPTMVDELIANPDKLKLGGEERELTLMFCDVRNFSALSQDLSAVDLTLFINELLSPLSEIILTQRGTIDKYMGDAIMAFWNAPVDDPDHTSHASCAAIEMTKTIQELNKLWRLRAEVLGRPFRAVKIGIGINTGLCCVGNLGSTKRFDYSAIGDEVNITSRFESLTKLYGVPAIVGHRALAPDFPALELDSVKVKGRTRPTKIYTLCGLLEAQQLQLEALGRTYSKFLEAYRMQQWATAEQLLKECRKIGVTELESCYSLFETRMELFRHEAVPVDWDGSFAMTEK